MISNMLMGNDNETEFLNVGSKQQLERVNIRFIHAGGDWSGANFSSIIIFCKLAHLFGEPKVFH